MSQNVSFPEWYYSNEGDGLSELETKYDLYAVIVILRTNNLI